MIWWLQFHPETTPLKINDWNMSSLEVWFRSFFPFFSWVIFRWTMLIFQGVLLMVQKSGKLTSWGNGSLSHDLEGLCIPGGAGFLPSTVSHYKFQDLSNISRKNIPTYQKALPEIDSLAQDGFLVLNAVMGPCINGRKWMGVTGLGWKFHPTYGDPITPCGCFQK